MRNFYIITGGTFSDISPHFWDATNLTQVTREHLIALFMSYDARVRVVYVEVPLETLRVQNSDREHVVPWGSSRR